MIDIILIAENKPKDVRLLVEDAGPELGYYLYVMRSSTGEIYKDHLCDNMEQLFLIAMEDYQISHENFHKPSD